MPSLRVAIAGLGTVGSASLCLLQKNAALIEAQAGRSVDVVAVCEPSEAKRRENRLTNIQVIDDPLQLGVMPDIDVVVETIGGVEGVARELCEKALKNSKHVVTANKALLATHGAMLAQLARKDKPRLMFEAAVAGGVPVIKTVREALAGNQFNAIQGILNGTCNYILTRMVEDKLAFEDALKEAQEKGYAEADPSMDIDGHDSAHKLAILTALAFGVPPDLKAVSIEGLRGITPLDMHFAAELDCRIKLLGVARLTDQGLEQRVGPCLVPLTSPLATIDGVLNAILLQSDAAGDVTLIGRGAGGQPTASAIVGDLIDLARGNNGEAFGLPASQLKPIKETPPSKRESTWYVRLNVVDRAGVVADVSAILRDEVISIESMLQHGRSRTDSVPVIIRTHTVDEAAMTRAMEKIARLEAVRNKPCCMRIENT